MFLYRRSSVDTSLMATTSGIKARGQEYVNKVVLKDADFYGPWRAKLTLIDARDCWIFVISAPIVLGRVVVDGAVTNQVEITTSRAELKD